MSCLRGSLWFREENHDARSSFLPFGLPTRLSKASILAIQTLQFGFLPFPSFVIGHKEQIYHAFSVGFSPHFRNTPRLVARDMVLWFVRGRWVRRNTKTFFL